MIFERENFGSWFDWLDENNLAATPIGRPVAYYPRLAVAVGGDRPGIFLCRILSWYGKGSAEGSWIWKTSDEIEDETGLSYDEQVTARKRLRELGILEEKYDRLNHRMAFRLDLERLKEVWLEALNNHPDWNKKIIIRLTTTEK